MSRSDQYIGLSKKAKEFLKENGYPEEICPTCSQIITRPLETIGEFFGMFGTSYPLHRHPLKDGRYADEFLQADPWDSGPMFFIGLKVSDGTKLLWNDDEIER